MKREIPLVWLQVIGLTGTLGICEYMSGNCLVFYRLVLSVYGEFPSLDDQKHIFPPLQK